MSLIITDDFRYMSQGKVLNQLPKDQAYRLAPIYIQGEKNERALLLLHGFASSPAVYRLMIPAITAYDALMCPVLPGHGSSLAAFSETKAADWLAAVESACTELLSHYQTVDIIGLSLGGLLACHLATKFPINHLYLLAPALKLRQNIQLTRLCAATLQWFGLKYIKNDGGDIRTTKHSELTYRQLPLTTILEVLTFIKTGKPLRPITCSIDLFLGRYDHVVDVENIAASLGRMPNTMIYWLENSAHVLPLDNDVNTLITHINAHQ